MVDNGGGGSAVTVGRWQFDVAYDDGGRELVRCLQGDVPPSVVAEAMAALDAAILEPEAEW